nr:Chain A, Anti-sigma factor [Acetivibrio thermocellus DSM 1313]
MYGYICVDIN